MVKKDEYSYCDVDGVPINDIEKALNDKVRADFVAYMEMEEDENGKLTTVTTILQSGLPEEWQDDPAVAVIMAMIGLTRKIKIEMKKGKIPKPTKITVEYPPGNEIFQLKFKKNPAEVFSSVYLLYCDDVYSFKVFIEELCEFDEPADGIMIIYLPEEISKGGEFTIKYYKSPEQIFKILREGRDPEEEGETIMYGWIAPGVVKTPGYFRSIIDYLLGEFDIFVPWC